MMVEQADRTGFRGMAKLAFVHTLYNSDTANRYQYEHGKVAKLGRALLTPIEWPLHQVLRQITNPLMIVSLTMVGVGAASIGFYPTEFRDLVSKVIPIAHKIRPWMLKFALYGAVQGTTLGLGIRAFDRYSNPGLVQAWRTGTIDGEWIGHHRRGND